MIWIHYKRTINVHWSQNKEITDFYPVTNPFFLFFVTSGNLKNQTHDFVNYFSIRTNEIAKHWDQLPWCCHWNHSMINTQSFIWHDVEQWVNLKWNTVTMKKGIKITIYDLLPEKNAFSRAIILIQTSSYHSSICRKQVKISFIWLFLKHQVRNIVTPSMATLIVSWLMAIGLTNIAGNYNSISQLLYK